MLHKSKHQKLFEGRFIKIKHIKVRKFEIFFVSPNYSTKWSYKVFDVKPWNIFVTIVLAYVTHVY